MMLENGAALFINGCSIFKLEDGTAPFKNGAGLKMEPNTYTTINGKALHLVFSFIAQGFISGSDIRSKFHQGSDGNCQA